MIRRIAYFIPLLAVLLAGCNNGSKLASFWDDVDVTVTESNFQSAQDRFAQFAELLVAAPRQEALDALNDLIDRLQDNEVNYIIYAEWIESALHNYLSPCRNPELFKAAVERFAAEGTLGKDEIARLQSLTVKDAYNGKGQPCTLPEGVEPQGNALYLVLNLDCRSCLEALSALSVKHPEAAHIALCFGYGRIPELPGWTYLRPEGMQDIFELEAAPFWFLTASDGTVETPYSLDIVPQGFANPEAL